MKFIISEEKLSKAYSRFLDLQNFVRDDDRDEMFLFKNEGDEYAMLVYQKKSKKLYIRRKVVETVLNFVSDNYYKSIQIIIDWFEQTYETPVKAHWVGDNSELNLFRKRYHGRTKQS